MTAPLLTGGLGALLAGCAGSAAAPAGPPNIILISIDGLRGDRRPEVTPTLSRLAAEGLRFERAFSQSNESLFSHSSMLTGRYVSELGAPDYRTFTLGEDAMTAAEILGLYGYATGGFVAGGHVKGVYGFDQGFSVFRDSHDFGAFFHTAPEALEWVDERAREPFFLFLHGYDCHRPYPHAGVFHHAFGADYRGPVDEMMGGVRATEQVYDGVYYPDFPLERFTHAVGDPIIDPDGYLRIATWAEEQGGGVPLSEADLDHLRDHYDGGALAADLQLERFLESLEERGLLENTLVIATSDHGEDLHDHGFFNHRAVLRDSTTRVPLVIWGAPIAEALRGTTRGELAQAVDVLPTLLAAAGAEAPAGLPGRDLLGDAPAPEIVFQEGVLDQFAARSARWRLVMTGVPLAFEGFDAALALAPMAAPWFALYDLEADPREQRSVLAEQLEEGEALRQAMIAWRAERARSSARGAPPDDPELRELLKKRGYW